MVSDNLSQNSKHGDKLIEQKQSYSLNVIRKRRHGLRPLCKVVDNHYDIMMSPSQRRVACDEINAPLCKWTNGNDGK
jgi:hypothetical protein